MRGGIIRGMTFQFDPARFAVISDIHGNVDALLAVLADIDRQGIASILNLGDHFSGPLAAGETAAVLAARPMLSIRGNHDRWLIEVPPEKQSASEAIAYPQLGVEALDWLAALPPVMDLGEVFLCHGTPDGDMEYLLEDVRPNGDVLLRGLDDIRDRVAGITASLILCGHSHRARRIDLTGGPVILNPGSVGCPGYAADVPFAHKIEAGSPNASYAIIEKHGAQWQSEIRSIPYDSTRMAALARNGPRSGWARVLATGWVEG